MRYVGVGVLVLFKQCVSVSMRVGFRVDLYGTAAGTLLRCQQTGLVDIWGVEPRVTRDWPFCVYILSTYIRMVRSRLGVGMSLWFFPRRRRPAGFLVDLL